MRILIADDHVSLRRSMVRALFGHAVTAVSCTDEAIEKVSEEHFDLLIVDYVMPSMAPAPFLALLRTHTNSPIVVHTSVDMYGHKYDGWIVKPCSANDILKEVAKHDR